MYVLFYSLTLCGICHGATITSLPLQILNSVQSTSTLNAVQYCAVFCSIVQYCALMQVWSKESNLFWAGKKRTVRQDCSPPSGDTDDDDDHSDEGPSGHDHEHDHCW